MTCIAAIEDVICIGSKSGCVYVIESMTGLLIKEIPYQSNFYVNYTPTVVGILCNTVGNLLIKYDGGWMLLDQIMKQNLATVCTNSQINKVVFVGD